MKKIAILIGDSNGSYPVPAVRGSAISTLVEHILQENSKNNEKELNIDIYTFYDEEALKESKRFNNVNFVWVKQPKFIKTLDQCIYMIISKIFKKKKAISYKTLGSLLYYIFFVSRKLKKCKDYDKVILENNVPLAWTIRLSKYKGEYYYHFHNIPRTNMHCKKVFENCTGYLCVSQYIANQIMQADNAIGPVSPDKAMILYNCIDTNQFYKKEEIATEKIRNKYKIDEDDKIILFVGRISAEKGLSQVINSLSFIKTKQVKLLIAGSFLHNTSEKNDYQIEIEKSSEKFNDKIVWTGYIEAKELVDLYNLADIAVLPSMWEEPAGLTMIEALACGIPVITTRSGGIPEYVKDNAILLDKDDEKISEKIAEKIDEILNDKSYYSRENIEKRCNSINVFYNTDRYYKDFIKLLYKE